MVCAVARRWALLASSSVGVATIDPARRTPSLRNTAMRASGACEATEKAPRRSFAGMAARIQPSDSPAAPANRTHSATSDSCALVSTKGRLTAIASSSRSTAGENERRSGAGVLSEAESVRPSRLTSQSVRTKGMSSARMRSARSASAPVVGRRPSPSSSCIACMPTSAPCKPRLISSDNARDSTLSSRVWLSMALTRRCHKANAESAAKPDPSTSATSAGRFVRLCENGYMRYYAFTYSAIASVSTGCNPSALPSKS